MVGNTSLLAATMIFAFLACSILYSIRPTHSTSEVPCPDGRLCPARWHCCPAGCCAPLASSPATDDDAKEFNYPWYTEWPVLFLLGTISSVVVCCVWCMFMRSYHGDCPFSICCCDSCEGAPTSELDSAGSLYPPPRYSRCGSFHQAPPPYSEVTSKPELYPLVITCAEGDNKNGGNYLMVHYFRNYVIRAPGSLSATSTTESLNSSFICNATNEANSIVPPPYSHASVESVVVGSAGGGAGGGGGCGRSLLRSLSSLTEQRPRTRQTDTFRENLITSPVQPLQEPSFDLEMELIDCEMYCDGGCKPRVGASPPARRSPRSDEEDAGYTLRMFPSPERPAPSDSPPRATSPTQTSRDSTLRRTSDEHRHRRRDSLKKTPRQRKASLYMPLSLAYPIRSTRISPGTRVSSRSAPATPCGSLVPNLLAFGQRVSASRHSSKSSKLEEEHDPLIGGENDGTDPKF